VGCTLFKRLLLRLNNHSSWQTASNIHFPFPPHTSNGDRIRTRGEHYTFAELLSMLRSPLWTKIVFVRDPAVRFLSGYLDKCVSHIDSVNRRPWCYNMTFREAILLLGKVQYCVVICDGDSCKLSSEDILSYWGYPQLRRTQGSQLRISSVTEDNPIWSLENLSEVGIQLYLTFLDPTGRWEPFTTTQ